MDDVKCTDGGLRELALFAGAGGGILAGKLLGWRTICAVERDPYAASVLIARQNDGILDPFPVWDDVCTFDGRPWRGIVDVVSGGFPCQDISVAGKGEGIDGARSGLWSEMARIVDEVRPLYVLVENSPALTVRGLGRVLGDLASLGYDAEWGVLGAVHAGAPHKRERIWIVAYAPGVNRDEWRSKSKGFIWQAGVAEGGEIVADSDEIGRYRWSGQFGRSGGAEPENGSGNPDTHCLRELQPQRGEQDERGQLGNVCDEIPDPNQARLQGGGELVESNSCRQTTSIIRPDASGRNRVNWWATEPDVGRVAHGVAARVDRLKALGNGQVPAVAALAWEVLK